MVIGPDHTLYVGAGGQFPYWTGKITEYYGLNCIFSFDGIKWKKLYKSGDDPNGYYGITIALDKKNPEYLLYGNSKFLGFGYLNMITLSNSEFRTDFSIGSTAAIISDNDNIMWIGCHPANFTYIVSLDRQNLEGKFVLFNDQTTGITSVPKAIAVDRYNSKWFGWSGGITRFDGASWKTFAPADWDSTKDAVSGLGFDADGVLWVGTNKGLYRFEEKPLSAEENEEKPQAVCITSISPNPFNPSTTISFSLPAPEKTELAVYSVSGQRVRTLLYGSLTTGTHSIAWDGRDDSGKLVSSGVYLSRLTVGNHIATGKMLLLR